jgi:RHS repeat-associated protein
VYNALGQRVEDYQSDAGGNPMTLTYPMDISGQRTGAFAQWPSQNWTGWNVYWASVAGQRLNMGGVDAYIDHSDAVGSTTMETDPAGAVQWDVTHYPWGRVFQETGIRQSEVVMGLDWQVNDPVIPSATREFNFRDYRWMTPDPGGVKVVKLDDPQTWNMYAYVGNNPTSLNDPSGESIELTCTGDDSNCAKERHEELQALQQAVGTKAGSYLYENPVTTTDANGNSITRYYVGIYSGGPGGKGPAFSSINAVADKLGGIINDHRVASIQFVDPGTSIAGALIGPGSPAATTAGSNASYSYVTRGNLGTFRKNLTADGRVEPITLDIVLAHEMGHVDSVWFHNGTDTNGDAVRIENQVRMMQGLPIRIGHTTPFDVPLWNMPF